MERLMCCRQDWSEGSRKSDSGREAGVPEDGICRQSEKRNAGKWTGRWTSGE